MTAEKHPLETVREALTFYADQDNWSMDKNGGFSFLVERRAQSQPVIPDGMVLMPRDVLMSWFNVAGFEVPVELAIAPFEDGELGIYQATKQCRCIPHGLLPFSKSLAGT